MQKENSQQQRVKTRRYTITGGYSNAHGFRNGVEAVDIEQGDIVSVKVGAGYTEGDVVLFECSRCYTDKHSHYHAAYYRHCSGKKYAFTLGMFPSSRSGTQRHTEEERKQIIGVVVRVYKKTEPERTHRKTNFPILIDFDWPLFDLHKSDVLTVETTQKVRPGQLALVKYANYAHVTEPVAGQCWLARVCTVSDKSVRLAGGDNEPDDYPISYIVGVVIDTKHLACAPTKIEALREKIASLQTSDDPISHTSKCYQLEKEIFDLEHPVEDEEEEDFEWPDLIRE
jgi:hypothetical protein